jgi:hypothetical protein
MTSQPPAAAQASKQRPEAHIKSQSKLLIQLGLNVAQAGIGNKTRDEDPHNDVAQLKYHTMMSPEWYTKH